MRAFSEQKDCDVIELNVQLDHVHLVVMVPPKVSISDYKGFLKGCTVKRVFNKFRNLKKKPYWDNHFYGSVLFSVKLEHEPNRR